MNVFFLKTFVLSIVNMSFVWFSPYLRVFLNDVFNPVWKSPYLRRWKKAPQTPIKSNKVKSNRKPTQKKKSTCKCEAEEIYQQNQKKLRKTRLKNGDQWHKSAGGNKKIEVRTEICWVLCYMKFSLSKSFFALYVLLQRIL